MGRETSKQRYIWHLNEGLLNSQQIVEQLKAGTRNYIEVNLGNEESIQVVWDVDKAVVRGLLMKLNYEAQEESNKQTSGKYF